MRNSGYEVLNMEVGLFQVGATVSLLEQSLLLFWSYCFTRVILWT